MRDALLMCGADGVRHGNRDVEDLRQRQAALDDQITERFPLDVLHREEEGAIGFFHRVNRDDVGMIERGNGPAPRARTARGVLGRQRSFQRGP